MTHQKKKNFMALSFFRSYFKIYDSMMKDVISYQHKTSECVYSTTVNGFLAQGIQGR